MIHDRAGHTIIQRRRIAGCAKGAGLETAPSPARDLRQFIRGQLPHAASVEFAEAGKRHVIHIQIQTHADGIRGHQKIDVPVLVHLDLSVACSRAERPHYHRRTTLLAADQFGNRIYILNRKPDNSTARAHAAYLFLT